MTLREKMTSLIRGNSARFVIMDDVDEAGSCPVTAATREVASDESNHKRNKGTSDE